MNKFIRFGEIPTDKNIEISVYETSKNINGIWSPLVPIPCSNPMMFVMLRVLSSVQFENIPVYLVTGEVVGIDEDGATILKHVEVIENISKDYGVVKEIKNLGILDYSCIPSRSVPPIKRMLGNTEREVRLIDFIFYMEALKCDEVIKPRGLGKYHLPQLIDSYNENFCNSGKYSEERANAKTYIDQYIIAVKKLQSVRIKYVAFDAGYKRHLSYFKAKYGYK